MDATLIQDLRYAMRTLRKDHRRRPAVAGPGNRGQHRALFQLLDALRLRTLPVDDPKRLALVELADRTRPSRPV